MPSFALRATARNFVLPSTPACAHLDAMSEPVPPVVRRLGWLHFWNDFTLDFLTPLLPIGVGVAWIGLMEGVADGIGQALKLVTGRASDRTGRRVAWVASGYGINAVLRPLAAVGMLLAWPWWIVLCRIGDRVGKGVRGSASDALVADWTPEAQRPWAYALMRTMDHLGATFGALVAAAVTWWCIEHLHWQVGWLVAGLVVPMACMLVLLAGLRDHPQAAGKSGAAAWWPSDPALRRPLACIGIAALGAKIGPLLVLVAVAGWPNDDARWHPWQLCLAWAALGLVQTGAAAFAGWLTERLGPRRFLVAGWLVGALVFTCLATVSGAWLLAAGLGWGVLSGLSEGAEKSWLANLAAKPERATAFGALGLLSAIGAALGGSLCGFGLKHFGAPIFWLPVACLTIGALGLLGLRPVKPVAA
jgi:MFS family permease